MREKPNYSDVLTKHAENLQSTAETNSKDEDDPYRNTSVAISQEGLPLAKTLL